MPNLLRDPPPARSGPVTRAAGPRTTTTRATKEGYVVVVAVVVVKPIGRLGGASWAKWGWLSPGPNSWRDLGPNREQILVATSRGLLAELSTGGAIWCELEPEEWLATRTSPLLVDPLMLN